MKFKQFGNHEAPCIIMLHGGGLSWWSVAEMVKELQQDYCIVTPIIDGHGEDYETTFVSIEDSAQKLLSYIKETRGGTVHAIYGLSIGSQIALEALCQKHDLAQFAILESTLVSPSKVMSKMTASLMKLSYPLIKKRSFARLQAKTLFVPDELIDTYYRESSLITRDTLVHLVTSNAMYPLKEDASMIQADTLILFGSLEMRSIRYSAEMLKKRIPNSRIFVAEKLGHGELSQKYPHRFLPILKQHITK